MHSLTPCAGGNPRYMAKLAAKEKARIEAFKPPAGFGLAIRTTLSRQHPKEVMKCVAGGGGGLQPLLQCDTHACCRARVAMRRYMARLQDQFIKRKRAEASRKVMSEQRLMARIMQNWAGLGVKSVFERWKKYTSKMVRTRRKMEARRRRINK